MSLEAPATQLEQEENKIEETGSKFLSEEIDRLPESKKTAGFLLTSVLAMGLSMMSAGKVEARGKYFPPMMSGSEITRTIIAQGKMGAERTLERKEMEANTKTITECEQKTRQLAVEQNRLEEEFRNGNITVQELEAGKQMIEQERARINREKDIKTAHPLGIKGTAIRIAIRHGI